MAIMKLKNVLDGQAGQAQLAAVLLEAKENLINEIESKRTKAKMGELQGQLNRMFYPVGSNAFNTDYANQRLATATEESLMQAFRNFDFENQTGHYTTGTTAMSPNTLAKTLKSAALDLQRILEQIATTESETDLQHLFKLRDETKRLIQEGESILENAERSLQFGTKERITGDDFTKASAIVNKLMGLSKILSVPDFVTPQEAGLIFEQALAMTNFVNDASDAMAIEAARELAKGKVFGAESIARGGDIIQYTLKLEDVFEDDAVKSKRFKINKGNMTATYTFNPGEARQGKMDVQLTYDQDHLEDYRVSAKRWSRGFGDLGETSIEAGLGRHGLTLLEAYKFGVLKPNNDWLDGEEPSYMAAQAAHDWAIMALKADIAMGITQGKTNSGAGYANVLIVDTGKEIKVRDLADVVLNDKHKLSKYEAGKIESEASRIYNAMGNIATNRTDTYLANTGTMLDKMKVTIRMDFNKSGT